MKNMKISKVGPVAIFILLLGLFVALPLVSGQSKPSISSFSASGVPGADDFVNINDNAQASCTATDSAFIKEIAIMELTPDGANKTAYFEVVSGNQITKTITSSNMDVSGASGQKLAGTYQFYCKATNKNNVVTESNKISVSFPAACAPCPAPSEWTSCDSTGNQDREVYGCSGAPEYVCAVNSTETRPCDPCNSKNLQYCNTTSKCSTAGGFWNTTTNKCSAPKPGQTEAPIPTAGATPTPVTVRTGQPLISSIGFDNPDYIVGASTGVFCKATDAELLDEIQIMVTSPDGVPKEMKTKVNTTSGEALIQPYNLSSEGIYTVVCSVTDSSGNVVASTKTIDVGKTKKVSPTPEAGKRAEATVLAEEKISVAHGIMADVPIEFAIPQSIIKATGATKILVESSQNITENTTIEVKAFNGIPSTDETGQEVKLLNSDKQPVLKVMQFSPSVKLWSSVKKATIEFTLTEDELNKSSVKAENIVLARFSGGSWTELETKYLGTDNSTGVHIFRATSPGFSVFVVTAKESSIVKVIEETLSKPKVAANFSCSKDSDCVWYASNGCTEQTGAIWKCGSIEAQNTTTGSSGESCSAFYVPKPKAENCGCVENKCAPIDLQAGEDKNFLKASLLDALITIEQFKIRFDHLSKRSKQISDYYDKPDSASDYTTWFTTSSGFEDGVKKLESIRKDIKAVKGQPTGEEVDRITKQIEDVVKILDTSLDFLLKDILDIGTLGAEETIGLAVGQAIKVEIEGEEHTLTVNSIKGNEVEFLVNSTPQVIKVNIGEEKKLSLAEAAQAVDTKLGVSKVEKNVVYVRIGSLLAQLTTDIQCTELKSDLRLADSEVQTCYNIVGNDVTFEGNGKTLNGGGLGYGIFISGNGATVKNVMLKNYMTGIKMSQTTGSTVENVNIILNKSGTVGIEVSGSSNNRIANNIIEVGKVLPGDITAGGIAILNDVVLQDATGGGYTPFVSVTSLVDESKYLDSTGTNPLESIKFEITVAPKGKDTRNKPGKVEVDLRKGQTKFEKVDALVYPDGDEAEVQVTIRALGNTLDFTKKINLNVPFIEE